MSHKKLSQHSLLKDDNQHPWQIMKTGYYSKHHHGWGKKIGIYSKTLTLSFICNIFQIRNGIQIKSRSFQYQVHIRYTFSDKYLTSKLTEEFAAKSLYERIAQNRVYLFLVKFWNPNMFTIIVLFVG